MLVLLPPSEGKNSGTGDPLDLATMSGIDLTETRKTLLDGLSEMCRNDADASLTNLGLSAGQRQEVTDNVSLDSAPASAASEIYSGVLYGALDLQSLTPDERARAQDRLRISSGLFGLLSPDDEIPRYRCSGSATITGIGKVTRSWTSVLPAEIDRQAEGRVIVDMRSGTYVALAPPSKLESSVVTVHVWKAGPGGRKVAASHFNKATKGLLARALVRAKHEPQTPEALERALDKFGAELSRNDRGWVLNVPMVG